MFVIHIMMLGAHCADFKQ